MITIGNIVLLLIIIVAIGISIVLDRTITKEIIRRRENAITRRRARDDNTLG